MFSFNHKKIERKWREEWDDKGVYEVDLENAKKPFYNLMMFPYPSAEGLHVGNMYAFTGADIYGRYKAMRGYDVFEPIGLDGFGIHSENYAIKIGKHPKEQAKISEKRFYDQLSKIGNRFSWNNRLETYDPEYYKWTQWLFVKMYENGLAYRKKSLVNWCPSCKTVLADAQVEQGKCERCKTETTKKETYQWFFKITDYAQRLLDGLDKIDWPNKIKTAQRNWIGRKEGVEIDFEIKKGSELVPIKSGLASKPEVTEPLILTCFTTRPDTLYGATFMVVAPEYAKKLLKYVPEDKKDEVEKYIKKALKKTEQTRKKDEKSKTGVDMGIKVINLASNKKLPVFVADYVLMDYGSGAVMGVPAHDQRDWDFAKKYNLDIVEVIKGGDVKKQAYAGEGKIVNSGKWNELMMPNDMGKIIDDVEERKIGKRKVEFRLRDWCISRQRYWGPPIPMVYCEKCAKHATPESKEVPLRRVTNAGWYPEKLENLPVVLPDIKDFKPTGDGKSPLEKADKDWLYTKCPKCGAKAKRETDVSDTFLDSSWYFLRYPSIKKSATPESKQVLLRRVTGSPFDKKITENWLPVNAYIGGAEHAVLHLMYSRFVWMALCDWGILPASATPESHSVPLRRVKEKHKSGWSEPFPFLFGHGLIIKDGSKMSKSKGNIINPDKYIEKYGADVLRMYLMFIGPYEQGGDFKDTGIQGMKKFLDRVWRLFDEKINNKTSKKLKRKLEQTIKKVGEDMGSFNYNTAIAKLMECTNLWKEDGEVMSEQDGQKFLQLMAPIAPFISEELWSKLGGEFSIHNQKWPKYDEKLIESEKVIFVIQVNGKLRGQFEVDRDEVENEKKMIKLA
ncbi:MAG: leucine--tRNA ligase, partial [Patescibacteria group bacterium]|nr:leucine--tRNA ligase [Patescibacteria group bacterium]